MLDSARQVTATTCDLIKPVCTCMHNICMHVTTITTITTFQCSSGSLTPRPTRSKMVAHVATYAVYLCTRDTRKPGDLFILIRLMGVKRHLSSCCAGRDLSGLAGVELRLRRGCLQLAIRPRCGQTTTPFPPTRRLKWLPRPGVPRRQEQQRARPSHSRRRARGAPAAAQS